MRCPSCNHYDSKVVDSRPTDDGSSVRRRRECLECGNRFTTYERLGENPLVIVKSDGSGEVYDREKLFRGVMKACAKRPVSSEQISELIDDIEAQLRNSQTTELKAKALGTMVLERLRALDDVSYIRFASVYQDFQNIEEFAHALEGLD